MPSLLKKTIIITGSSRGIGRAMALRFARDGANIIIAAKSAEPHPKLKGTIFDVAGEVEAIGGQALPLQVDVRSEDQIADMVQAAVNKFGGIDALVNNAGAISLTKVQDTSSKRYDLMQSVNARAVFLCSQAVLPYLKSSPHPHILSLSPPLNLDRKWFKDFAPYTVSKYGMTMLTMGMAQEFNENNIAVNCLWPRTAIATAAIEFAIGNRDFFKHCRTTEILADAAHELLTTEDCRITGQTLLDEDFLAERGYTDFAKYAYDPEHTSELIPDFFLD